jgi:glycosyltransferase involved in cell wall biosynthesis
VTETRRWGASDVTVMICAHDAEAVLGSALASVAGQTVRPGTVVVLDDGSSDATTDRARSWAGRLPVDVVRLDTNVGLPKARMVALEHVPTPLVAILDTDDVWLPDHLETMLAAYNDRPGLVTARELLWAPGVGIGPADERHRAVPPAEDQLRTILDHDFVAIGTLFARRDVERVGGFRDCKAAEDWDLWIRMIRAGVPVVRASHPTLLYRISPASVSFGYGQARGEVQAVERAAAEASSAAERAWALRSVRRYRARAALGQAFEAARDGNAGRARRLAWRAVRGTPSVALRAIFLLVAPRLGVRIRDERAYDLRGRVS